MPCFGKVFTLSSQSDSGRVGLIVTEKLSGFCLQQFLCNNS